MTDVTEQEAKAEAEAPPPQPVEIFAPNTPAMGILNATADAIEEIDHAIDQLRTFQNRLKAEANILAGRMVDYTDAAKRITDSFAGFVEANGKLIDAAGDPKW